MELLYATTNSGKIHSLQRELKPYGVKIIQVKLDIPEPRSNDVEEIAKEKARWVFNTLGKPVVVSDAGFYIKSLNGFPRAFVNFALETIGLDGLLTLVARKSRKCEFRECVAYIDETREKSICFTARVKGTLSEEERGVMQDHHWSPLALIFIPEGNRKTLAEMNYDEYLEWKRTSKKESSAQIFSQWFIPHIPNGSQR